MFKSQQMSNADRTFLWDHFVDHCTENDLDPDTEDFDSWLDSLPDEY